MSKSDEENIRINITVPKTLHDAGLRYFAANGYTSPAEFYREQLRDKCKYLLATKKPLEEVEEFRDRD